MVLTQWETLCGLFFAFFEKIVVPILTSGGYVGLSLGVLLSQHHQVVAVDIVQAKVDMIFCNIRMMKSAKKALLVEHLQELHRM